uniref:Archaeal flagella protein FlaD/E domain-containing protein n=1 Tax=Geoglobus ahangari TaxID=113653 RepID=A0A7C4S8P7_9EURY
MEENIDEIISRAEADSPESRLNKLEKELDILKGSIKKLLLDIRETLNNLDNPFQNLQGLAESLAISPQRQPQQIQIIPPPPQDTSKVEPEKKDDVKKEFEEKKEAGGSIMSQSYPNQFKKYEEVIERSEKPERVTVEEKLITKEILKKYDILTLFEIMAWVKGMLEKYSIDSVKLMLEIFESAGYIMNETRDFISKVADLIAMNEGFEDILLELYRLHKIINPHDTTMDSKLLALMLDKKI